jgi:NADP-dependent 3-hydroxy acid dehydrogenase YdfG
MSSAPRRAALISGASAGIGRAGALALAESGFDLFLGGRDPDRLAGLVQQLREIHPTGRFQGQTFDVRRADQIEAAVRAMIQVFGRIDLLVVSAGVGVMDFLDRLDPEDGIRRQIETNLTGAVLLCRAVLPSMMRQRSGTIVLVGSLSGLVATPSYSIYAATKFGLAGFADALRREAGPWGIRVCLLLPGAVATGFAEESVLRRRTRLRTPNLLLLQPDQVGRTIARLAERPRRVWLIPWTLRPAIWLARAFPGLVDWVTQRFFVRPERFPGPEEGDDAA